MPKQEAKLKQLFNYQRIVKNKSLKQIIKATEARYCIGTK